LQEDVNRFHRHLRAFFWELIAEFDMLLAYVNEIEALGVPEASVSWSTLASAALNLGKWPDTLKRLADVYCSKWFTEVRYYRNFAHRSSLFLQCAYDGSLSLTHAWLLPSIEGESPNYDLRQQLSEYFHHMEKFLRP
jgi:hypothetical protein